MSQIARASMFVAMMLAVVFVSTSPVEAAGAQPRISQVTVERAPIGERGGIAMPTVYCTGSRTEPRVQVRITYRETGKKKTFRWVGSYPNAYFPRVPVGTYEVKTKATCQGNQAKKLEEVEVTEKTAETTMSRSEFNAITNGMTKEDVRQIVGYRGRSGGSYAGTVSRRYDLMPFWAWSYVDYRDGLVVSKYWDADHD